jgi:putative endonuclease
VLSCWGGGGAPGAMRRPPPRGRAESSGRPAEAATAVLLACKGYRMLARRLRTPVGEIDLVARRGGTVAFVEVKLRPTLAVGLEAVSPRGQGRIVAAAQWWLAANPEYVGYVLRFDVVVWAPWSWPRHLSNAFDTTR